MPLLKDHRPEMPDGVTDRAADVWEPLIAIADLARGDWPKRSREAAVAFVDTRRAEQVSEGARLLAACRTVFVASNRDRLSTAELVSGLTWLEEGWRLDPQRLANKLRPYGIRPVMLGSGTRGSRGYIAADFDDAWTRYLPEPATPATSDSGLEENGAGFEPGVAGVAGSAEVGPANVDRAETINDPLSPADSQDDEADLGDALEPAKDPAFEKGAQPSSSTLSVPTTEVEHLGSAPDSLAPAATREPISGRGAVHNWATGTIFDGLPWEDSLLGTPVLWLSEVEERPLEWIWPGRIPRAAITVVDGHPEAGKSSVLRDITARVTTGKPMPGEGDSRLEPAGVILLASEDGVDDVIVPRVRAAGGDPSKVKFVPSDGLRFPSSDWRLQHFIEGVGAVLVVIDPLSAHLDPSVSLTNALDMRRTLRFLAETADATEAAIVVVRHLRKSGGQGLGAGLGSVEIGARVRSALRIEYDSGTGLRTLVSTKCSLSASPKPLEFRIVERNGDVTVEWDLSAPVENAGDVGSLPWEG